MIKAKPWDKQDLKGPWTVETKLDGVRAFLSKDGALSRADKPLYNLENVCLFIPEGEVWDCEVFCGGFDETITATRTKNGSQIGLNCIFRLDIPNDKLVFLNEVKDPKASEIEMYMKAVCADGYEGLVLKQGDTWIKVKPKETYDVPITGLNPGTKRNLGRLGSFETPMGAVSSGIDDKGRVEYNDPSIIGSIIEVECDSLTKAGKFRFPRLVRFRPDKK